MLWILCFSRVLLYILRAAYPFIASGPELVDRREGMLVKLAVDVLREAMERPAPCEGTRRP